MQNILTCYHCHRWIAFTTLPTTVTAFCLRCRKPKRGDAPTPPRKPVQLSLFDRIAT